MPTKLEKIMIYIDPIKKMKIKLLAEEDGRSLSNYIVKLIDEAIYKSNQEHKQQIAYAAT